MVRPLASVDSHVCLQVSLLIEGSLASRLRANVLFEPAVRFQMHIQPLLPAVGLVASGFGAFELLLIQVRLQVVIQVALSHEGFAAALLGAREGPIRLMNLLMLHKQLDGKVALSAFAEEALVLFVAHRVVDDGAACDAIFSIQLGVFNLH